MDSRLPEASFRRKLQGLLAARLLLAIFFLVLTVIVQNHREEDLLSARLQPLYVLSCILFLFTIVAALSLNRVHNYRKFAYVQHIFDVAAVTFVIFLSGGVESPYPFLYMPVIVSAALLLYRKGSMLIASACSLSYGLLLDLQYLEWVFPVQVVGAAERVSGSGPFFHNILMGVAVFYLVAYLSGHLAEELQKSSLEVQIQKRDLHNLEVLHQNIVESMNSGLLTVTPAGLVRFSNRAAQRMLVLSPDRLVGKPLREIFPSMEPGKWPDGQSVAAGAMEPVSQGEIAHTPPGGETLNLRFTVSVLQSESGESSGWIVMFQDLTNLRAMEAHLQRMQRVALAGRIAAEIAHEIKNPLAAMSGAVQLLERDAVANPVHSRLMDIVHREIDRIDELVTNFLWMARSTSLPDKAEEMSVCLIIQEVLALLRSKEKLGPLQHVRTRFDCNPVIRMDSQHFRRILWNLFLNALEAMPDGGELSISVEVSEEREAGRREVVVQICDTGCGIAPENREKVFEPFFTTKETGTGLGLSIVYQLVQNAGGRMDVFDPEGPGVCFRLFFPPLPSFPLAKPGQSD